MAATGSRPTLVIVVAVSDNGVIGRAGKLPWTLPADLKQVKSLTMGKPLIMGRRTYESIGRPLPGRRIIVVSGTAGFAPGGVTVTGSFDAAMRAGRDAAREMQAGEVVAFGGEDIYTRALPRAQRIYKTEVHIEIGGDRRFPNLDPVLWIETSREDHLADGGWPAFSFVILERKADSAQF